MSRIKKILHLDGEVKVVKKRKATKPMKSKLIVTKEMIAEAAYYKAEQRGFNPGYEEHDWIEAERELGMV